MFENVDAKLISGCKASIQYNNLLSVDRFSYQRSTPSDPPPIALLLFAGGTRRFATKDHRAMLAIQTPRGALDFAVIVTSSPFREIFTCRFCLKHTFRTSP